MSWFQRRNQPTQILNSQINPLHIFDYNRIKNASINNYTEIDEKINDLRNVNQINNYSQRAEKNHQLVFNQIAHNLNQMPYGKLNSRLTNKNKLRNFDGILENSYDEYLKHFNIGQITKLIQMLQIYHGTVSDLDKKHKILSRIKYLEDIKSFKMKSTNQRKGYKFESYPYLNEFKFVTAPLPKEEFPYIPLTPPPHRNRSAHVAKPKPPRAHVAKPKPPRAPIPKPENVPKEKINYGIPYNLVWGGLHKTKYKGKLKRSTKRYKK
jgi:hypothetical protein